MSNNDNNKSNNNTQDLLSTEKVEEIVNIVKNKTVEGVTQAYSIAAEKTEEVYHYITSEEAKQKLQETAQTTATTLSSAYSWFSSNVTSLVGETYNQVSSALNGDQTATSSNTTADNTTSSTTSTNNNAGDEPSK